MVTYFNGVQRESRSLSGSGYLFTNPNTGLTSIQSNKFTISYDIPPSLRGSTIPITTYLYLTKSNGTTYQYYASSKVSPPYIKETTSAPDGQVVVNCGESGGTAPGAKPLPTNTPVPPNPGSKGKY